MASEMTVSSLEDIASQYNTEVQNAANVTIANDLPGAQGHEKITALGDGVAIKMMDGATICDIRMVKFMKNVHLDYIVRIFHLVLINVLKI